MVFLNVPSFEVLLPAALGSQLGTGQPQPGVCSANLPQYNHDRDHVKTSFCTAAEFLNCKTHPVQERFTQSLLCWWNNLG